MNDNIEQTLTLCKPVEKKRKRIRKLKVLRILMYIAPSPVVIVNLILFIVRLAAKKHFNVYNLAFFVSFIIIPCLIILILSKIISSMRKKWYIEYKETLIKDRFSKLFENTVFKYNKGIDKDKIASSGLVQDGGIYDSEDFLSGTYKGVTFERCDVEIRQVTPVKRINFTGQWMIFDFNKPIEAYVRIIEKYSFEKKKKFAYMIAPHAKLFDMLTDRLKNGAPNSQKVTDGKKVELEDMEFNKKFQVTTTHEHTAFYVLTPHFMESIKFLEKSLIGVLMIAFHNGKLHVGLHTRKNLFEPKLSRKINHILIQEIDEDAKIICKFIDILQLDNDYFKPVK